MTSRIIKNLGKHKYATLKYPVYETNKVKKTVIIGFSRIKSHKLERPFDVGYISRIYRTDPARQHGHVLEFSIACFVRLCGKNLKLLTEGLNCHETTFRKGPSSLLLYSIPSLGYS